jgi:branched-chain amino acid transport system ATP-binding protein
MRDESRHADRPLFEERDDDGGHDAALPETAPGSAASDARVVASEPAGNPPGWLLAKPSGPKDALSRIRGLGRATELRLNALGVFHFSQLSNMTEEDAEWLAARIQVPSERMQRERWASQAQALESQRKT